MNRHLTKYGNNTITRFDIVGSFFVNLFYNEFYKKSNNLNDFDIFNDFKKYIGLSLNYNEIIYWSLKNENDKNNYLNILENLNNYNNNTDNTNNDFVEFLNNMFNILKMHNSIFFKTDNNNFLIWFISHKFQLKW